LTDPRDATAAELEDWDAATVDAPGGHVYQSRAWAEHRAGQGWRPRFLVSADGGRTLVLTRGWALIGGASGYVPRGPRPAPGEASATAQRLIDIATALETDGIDVLAADPEVPAAEGAFGDTIRAAGFHRIEEIQPSRHRVTRPLAGLDEDTAFAAIAKGSRQRIRKAEREGVTVTRHDGRSGDHPGEGFCLPAGPTDVALDAFYDLLRATGERREFRFGPRSDFVAWWRRALAAGHLILLQAWAPGPQPADAEPLAGLLLYRHGERLSTVHSGDRAESRKEHPGALHLLRWRALQLAIREGRAELDLGGADVAGQRRQPREGDPMWGLYEHKRAFGGEWLELTGAHERVARPWRYAVGRLSSRAARVAGRVLAPPRSAR
jgi:lipid II:glycine glycyltransferase (peptidoglycan interpeptide bridge formation enzyme)